jgi:hypothetical protein
LEGLKDAAANIAAQSPRKRKLSKVEATVPPGTPGLTILEHFSGTVSGGGRAPQIQKQKRSGEDFIGNVSIVMPPTRVIADQDVLNELTPNIRKLVSFSGSMGGRYELFV